MWQSQDLSLLYQNSKNLLPYEQMGFKDGYIYASDFYGRNYKINVNNGIRPRWGTSDKALRLKKDGFWYVTTKWK